MANSTGGQRQRGDVQSWAQCGGARLTERKVTIELMDGDAARGSCVSAQRRSRDCKSDVGRDGIGSDVKRRYIKHNVNSNVNDVR